MSLSVREGMDWLAVCCVPLALVSAGSLAAWMGFSDPVDVGSKVQTAPFFEFAIPELNAQAQAEENTILAVGTEPFHGTMARATAQKKDEPLDLQEIQLGMVAMANEVKICLTNGRMMKEGQREARFAVDSISEQGVWYATGKERFFLKIGDKVNVDQDGSVHKLQPKPVEEKTVEEKKNDIP
jgi:hypothetical protein